MSVFICLCVNDFRLLRSCNPETEAVVYAEEKGAAVLEKSCQRMKHRLRDTTGTGRHRGAAFKHARLADVIVGKGG